MIKYSEIRTKLGFEIDKKTDNGVAYLTHFFQNYPNGATDFYKRGAAECFMELKEKTNLAISNDLKDFFPIEWNIPFPSPVRPKFTFIDLFAGIGGIRLAFQNLGGKCVFTSEWDNFCKKTYEKNFGEVPFDDITKIDEKEIPDHDILLAGFPCQPFSIAGVSKKNALGKAHGFLDKTQGTLFFDIARILKEKKPYAFLLENVKNLTSHDNGNTFKVITKTLKSLGYSIHYKVLDGQQFVPQHRERIIIVGFRKDIFNEKEKFEFPKLRKSRKKLRTILEKTPPERFTLTDHLWEYLQNYAEKHKAKGNGFGYGLTNVNGISRTLSARYYKDGSEILIPQTEKNPRRLTPRECARLQGFPNKFKIPVSDTQAYRQFGNAVIVPLIQSVGEILLKELIPKLDGTDKH